MTIHYDSITSKLMHNRPVYFAWDDETGYIYRTDSNRKNFQPIYCKHDHNKYRVCKTRKSYRYVITQYIVEYESQRPTDIFSKFSYALASQCRSQ